MIALFKSLWQWFLNREASEREAYFSGASDRVDLERRIRDWERDRLGLHGWS